MIHSPEIGEESQVETLGCFLNCGLPPHRATQPDAKAGTGRAPASQPHSLRKSDSLHEFLEARVRPQAVVTRVSFKCS